jgi:hypothetical protein
MKEGEQKSLKIIDIDEIPSLETISMNPTPILEEIEQPEVEAMKVYTQAMVQEPQNQEAKTLKEVQPERIKKTLEINGMMQNTEAEVEPRESQMTISEHPAGETTEDVLAWMEWIKEEQPEVVGTSSQPLQRKGNIQIPISPHKKPVT